MNVAASGIGVVVIGRNEGDGLQRAPASVMRRGDSVVYVDSGSSDDSVALARSMGVDVVALDASAPFTAARGRNAGTEYLVAHAAALEFIQFVDGDCALVADWIERAVQELRRDSSVAVVCGRQQERCPHASIYNRLCGIEWQCMPTGSIESCGGNAMIRVAGLRAFGGDDAAWRAGEEPELCLRLRAKGWKILGIDAEMSMHDAAFTRFGQWWRRARRTGYGYARAAALHGRGPERHRVHECRSIWFWAVVLPVVTLAAAPSTGGMTLWLWLGYPVLGCRIYQRLRARGVPAPHARLYA